jgi:putative nucleotidyltransferase with HDIG domain
MDSLYIDKTKKFVKDSFVQNPHFSFNHWSVMYNHSLKVHNIAMQIADHVASDRLAVAIGALLHDIGKTHKADEATLHFEHETFNLPRSEKFLDALGLPPDQLQKVKDLISYNSGSIEMKIIKDADALALYADKNLYMLYIEWAYANNLQSSIERKLAKFSKLNFPISREIGEQWFTQIKEDWQIYIQNQKQ